jgi:hypothetical protein
MQRWQREPLASWTSWLRLCRIFLASARSGSLRMACSIQIQSACWQRGGLRLCEPERPHSSTVHASQRDCRLGELSGARTGSRSIQGPWLEGPVPYSPVVARLESRNQGPVRGVLDVPAHEVSALEATMVYRDADEALRVREEHLRQELSDLERQVGALEELQVRRMRVVAELERVRADRAEQRAPVRLANLRIARPCDERWELMMGDERVRHCRRCDKDVFNLSAMRRDEAEALLADHDVRPCVRFYRRADGTIKTADCPTPGRRWLVCASATALAATVAAVMLRGGEARRTQCAPRPAEGAGGLTLLLWRTPRPPLRAQAPKPEIQRPIELTAGARSRSDEDLGTARAAARNAEIGGAEWHANPDRAR